MTWQTIDVQWVALTVSSFDLSEYGDTGCRIYQRQRQDLWTTVTHRRNALLSPRLLPTIRQMSIVSSNIFNDIIVPMVSVFLRASRLSVYVSVTLMDCDHAVQQYVEIGIWQDMLMTCLLACQNRSITWSVVRKMWRFAPRRHPTARMWRYLSICWASCSKIILLSQNQY